MTWQEFAFTIGNIETIAAFILCVFFWITTGFNATSIALTSWVLGNFVMERIAQLYKTLFVIYDKPEFMQHAWYLTWVFVHCIMLTFISLVLKNQKMESSRQCMLISTVIFSLSVVQIARYVDRFAINTNLLVEFYQWSVPSLNLLPVVVITLSIKKKMFIQLWQRVS